MTFPLSMYISVFLLPLLSSVTLDRCSARPTDVFVHPAPDQTLPSEVFSTFHSDVSMVWPQNPDPDGVSPDPSLTESQWVTQDILSKGSRGIRTILQLG